MKAWRATRCALAALALAAGAAAETPDEASFAYAQELAEGGDVDALYRLGAELPAAELAEGTRLADAWRSARGR